MDINSNSVDIVDIVAIVRIIIEVERKEPC